MPHHPAIVTPGSPPLAYRELREQIRSVIGVLNAHGFSRNDRIAVIVPAGPEMAACMAAVMAGFTAVPLNPALRDWEFRDLFGRIGVRALLMQKGLQTDAASAATASGIPVVHLEPVPGMAGKFSIFPETPPAGNVAVFAEPEDLAYVLLTSGTTGVSKIVPVSQTQAAISWQRMKTAAAVTPSDRCIHLVPYYHGSGIASSLMVPLISGATVICPREFIPSDFPAILKRCRPTICSAGPALLAGILREVQKLPPAELASNSLRYIRNGSAFLPEQVRSDLQSLLKVPVVDAYGMSETGSIAINLPPRQGSVGIPTADDVQILDDRNLPLPPGSSGEIVFRGRTIFKGYEGAPDENRAAFIGGWFRTGDLGYLDDDGYLYLTGRIKDLINKGGEKVSPAEIDRVLRSHPLVRDAMTFAIPDPVLGEDVAAMVVMNGAKIAENDLRQFLLDRLTPSKIPGRFCFVEEIPRNSAGKPLRFEGTKWYGQRQQEPINRG